MKMLSFFFHLNLNYVYLFLQHFIDIAFVKLQKGQKKTLFTDNLEA